MCVIQWQCSRLRVVRTLVTLSGFEPSSPASTQLGTTVIDEHTTQFPRDTNTGNFPTATSHHVSYFRQSWKTRYWRHSIRKHSLAQPYRSCIAFATSQPGPNTSAYWAGIRVSGAPGYTPGTRLWLYAVTQNSASCYITYPYRTRHCTTCHRLVLLMDWKLIA